MRILLLFSLFLLPFFGMCQENMAKLDSIEVNFTFSKSCKGDIFISCFQKEENFLDSEKAFYTRVLSCQDSIVIEGLDPTLPRAVLGYLDMNGNRELDLNFFGVPIEPYAISNNFKGKWREPVFGDAAEDVNSKIITLDFMFWKER